MKKHIIDLHWYNKIQYIVIITMIYLRLNYLILSLILKLLVRDYVPDLSL